MRFTCKTACLYNAILYKNEDSSIENQEFSTTLMIENEDLSIENEDLSIENRTVCCTHSSAARASFDRLGRFWSSRSAADTCGCRTTPLATVGGFVLFLHGLMLFLCLN